MNGQKQPVTKTEPAITVAVVTTAASAVLAVLASFGFDLTDQQQNAVLGLIAVLWPVVTTWQIRKRVYSPATVEKIATGQVRP